MQTTRQFYDYVRTPIGDILLVCDDVGLSYVGLPEGKHLRDIDPQWERNASRLAAAKEQFLAWFAGDIKQFDLPLHAQGTSFQMQVWQGLQAIPYGRTWSYGQLADFIGKPKAVRAVGAANGANPLSIVVPCHRVIGADGSLTGYGGGLAAKTWLLAHEKACAGFQLEAAQA